jgi:hypothetical protein
VAPTARGGGIQITYNHVYGTEGECEPLCNFQLACLLRLGINYRIPSPSVRYTVIRMYPHKTLVYKPASRARGGHLLADRIVLAV